MKLFAPPDALWRLGRRDRVVLFTGAGFGSGFATVAPGTVGTAFAGVLLWALGHSGLHAGMTISVLAVAATLLCFPVGGAVERMIDNKDPGFFVLDEFAGYFVCMMRVGAEWPDLRELFVGFVLFRLFDVAKPQPARWLQSLGGGPGIVLDDVAAGLYALMGVVVFRDVQLNPPW